MKVEDIVAIRLKLASPEEILTWSHGEVTKPETINYRTQRAEKDGLFCQKIFGPEKDYQCYCGKYKGIKYKGLVCDRCGVEITSSTVRRERMGHIKLAAPVSHIWFLRGIPSAIATVLGKTREELERVIYFISYIITEVDEEAKKKILEEIEREYQGKVKSKKSEIQDKKLLQQELQKLKEAKEKAEKEVKEIVPLRILSELEYRELSLKYGQCFKAGTGAETLRKIFEKLDLKKEIQKLEKLLETNISQRKEILSRLRTLKAMEKNNIRPEWMFLTVLPVLPPDLRPMVQLDGGRYASSDLNDLYRRVINRNNRLKYLLEIGAPDVIIRNEKRMLQEAVDALIDNGMRKSVTTKASTGGRRLLKSLADMLRGKQGRFRQNLLGKRVDYSGRSVIVPGPELKLSQVGLPKQMALEIFRPFVIRKLLEKEIVYNVKAANDLIEIQAPEVWDQLEEVVKDRVVLLNRAPTLHRLNIQAFYPVLIEGRAIRIHPMICKAYNADFDGDQMAVFLPISQKAQEEAKQRMLSVYNLLKPATGKPIVTLYQDIGLGCYFLTQIKEKAKGEGKIFSSKEEAILAYELGKVDLRAKIKVKIGEKEILETSVGRIIFNSILPDDFPFQNQEIKVKDLERIVSEMLEKYSYEKIAETLDKIKELGFEYSTISGCTFGIDDLIVPEEKKKIIEEAEEKVKEIEENWQKGFLSKEEKSLQVISLWAEAKSQIEKLIPQIFPRENPISQMITAGARGSWSQPVQMAGMKGLVVNPLGKIIELPVKTCYKEGLSVLEYFISTHGARKGMVDKALRTSTAGYLTRRLVDVAHEVIIREEDCRDKDGMEIFLKDAEEIGQDFLMKIVGRVTLEDIVTKRGVVLVKAGEIIDWKAGKKILEQKIERVRVRTPLTCKLKRGICQKCYGWDLGRDKEISLGEAVGIVAAQSIGEPGTQLTMRTFHYGGVMGEADITTGLPRVEEIFENRTPSFKEAVVSEVDGKVVEVTKERIKILSEKGENIEYSVLPDTKIFVRKGDKVKKGMQLTEGDLNFKKLYSILDKKELWRLMVKEIQKIYVSQGVQIHDKHLEVILRQMFSRVRIENEGDSDFLPGEIVEKASFLEEVERLKKEGKKPPKGKEIMLGISKVALTTESFLSGASFQETTRVLIKAAINAKVDRLMGLKENVIIGRLIPAGTGFSKEEK